jgi:uncharacterized protein (DUF2249 family)
MTGLTMATDRADAEAAEAVERHHAAMVGALVARAVALVELARTETGDLAALRDDLVAWGRQELLPHARAEEDTLYRAAGQKPEARLLVEAMLAEHAVIAGLVDELAATTDAVGAATAARALRAVFEVHLAKENDQVLPLLVGAPDVSVADLLGGMHELLGHESTGGSADRPATEAPEAPEAPEGHGPAGHTCGCHEADATGHPELDARTVPHAIRHATIFGALDAVALGKGLVLVAPHDPLPLLAQLEQRQPGAFEVDYLSRGPEAWRLLLVRRG